MAKMTNIEGTMQELNDMANFKHFGATPCSGCGNYFTGHSPDFNGAFCEHCGTKNVPRTSESCTINEHLVTNDGNGCLCGYFKKA